MAEPAEAVEVNPPAATPLKKGKLDRRTRVELTLILVSLIALGLGMMAFTWLGARIARRHMQRPGKPPPRPVDPVFTDDWAARPLTAEERTRLESDQW